MTDLCVPNLPGFFAPLADPAIWVCEDCAVKAEGEYLATFAHWCWTHFTKFLASEAGTDYLGVPVPKARVKSWSKLWAPYWHLPEKQKDKDRALVAIWLKEQQELCLLCEQRKALPMDLEFLAHPYQLMDLTVDLVTTIPCCFECWSNIMLEQKICTKEDLRLIKIDLQNNGVLPKEG